MILSFVNSIKIISFIIFIGVCRVCQRLLAALNESLSENSTDYVDYRINILLYLSMQILYTVGNIRVMNFYCVGTFTTELSQNS